MSKQNPPARSLLAVIGGLFLVSLFAFPALAASTQNILPNGDLSQANGGAPVGWSTDRWLGTEADFSYNGGNRLYLGVTLLSAKGGDAKWHFDDVNIVPKTSYVYSDEYRANVRSYLTARFKMADGSYQYKGLKSLKASAKWRVASAKIVPPANAVSLTVFHLIQKPGTLETSRFSLKGAVPANSGTSTPPLPPSDQTDLSRGGFVTLSFDDGELSAYQKAVPILDQAGIRGTFYISSEQIAPAFSGYVNVNQIKSLKAGGHEIGAHSRTHSHLLGADPQKLDSEIAGSKADLDAFGVGPIDTFAYTYGELDATSVQAVKDAGFLGARSTRGGLNIKTSDRFNLSARSLTRTDTFADVKKDIDRAVSEKGWYVLTFHRIDDPTDTYSNSSALLQQIVDYLKSNNIPTATVAQGLNQFVK